MALSNTINEPRRELTETSVGIAIVLAVTALMFYPGQALGDAMANSSWILINWIPPGVVATLVGMILCFIGTLTFLAITHVIGEDFCNALGNRNIEIRGERRDRCTRCGR